MKRILQVIYTPILILSSIVLAREGFAAPAGSPGVIKIDGSSTVFPISEAVAEEFQRKHRGINVTVGISGTGGGFKKLVAGEVDIVNASRPIKSIELEQAAKNGINFIELPIAYDALSVVINKKNSWVEQLTVKELAVIWAPESRGKISKWSDVRAGFPDKPLQLFGPGTDSGTFDYFTEAVVGKEKASRGDYTSSEDDNVIVTGVSGNEGALGFFGVAYYNSNMDKLKVIPIDDEDATNGSGPQFPTKDNVTKGSYRPLSRPLFIYVKKDSLERPEVREFVAYYLKNVELLAQEVGYIALPESTMSLVQSRLDRAVTGTLFNGKVTGVATLEQILKQ